MAKLGYTWYPKDWGSSESVFELTLNERGLYRELIDLAMLNNNNIEVKKDVWVRKFYVSINELDSILSKLIALNLIEINNNILFIESCESRLNLVRGGSKGGKKSKPSVKPILKPFESLEEKNTKPTPKQIEIETKIEIESKLNKIEKWFLDLPNSQNLELIAMSLNIQKEILLNKITEFKKSAKVDYLNFNEFCNHFKNWVKKNPTTTPLTKNRELK